MSEGNRNVVKYDMYRSCEMEGFEETHDVLILGMLQFVHLLVPIGADEVLDGDKLVRRRPSNGHSDETIKLELVDFLKALPGRFLFWSHVLVRADVSINGLRKDEILRTSSCLNNIILWRACSPSF